MLDGLGDEAARERKFLAAMGNQDFLLAEMAFSSPERIVEPLSEVQLIAIRGFDFIPAKVPIVTVEIGING
jgi:hypothetical protein